MEFHQLLYLFNASWTRLSLIFNKLSCDMDTSILFFHNRLQNPLHGSPSKDWRTALAVHGRVRYSRHASEWLISRHRGPCSHCRAIYAEYVCIYECWYILYTQVVQGKRCSCSTTKEYFCLAGDLCASKNRFKPKWLPLSQYLVPRLSNITWIDGANMNC